MPIPAYATPYGLRDVKLVNFKATPDVVDLPAAQTLTWSEATQSNQLRGDDVVVATVTFPESLEWELESGGISLEAYALMTGRTVTTSGVSPNVIKTISATNANSGYPYFKIYGKAVGQENDDVHVKIYYAKVTEISGELTGEEFLVTSCSGMAVFDGSGKLYDIVHNETATTLPAS